MRTFFLALMLFFILLLAPLSARPLHMLTDDYPPYSFRENGVISGICVEMIRKALESSAYGIQAQLYPFARAYATTRDGKDIFEFCVARTPEREPLFHWIGPVGPTNEGLIALTARTDIRIRKDADMKNFRIGTVIEDVVDQHLSSLKDPLGLRLDKTSSYRQNMRKLLAGRIDLWAGNLLVGFQLARELNHQSVELRVAHAFPDLDTDFYLVTGMASDPLLVRDLTRLFDDFVASGAYRRMAQTFLERQIPGNGGLPETGDPENLPPPMPDLYPAPEKDK